MPGLREYSGFEIFGIRAILKHLKIIVAFNHYIVGLTKIMVGSIGDVSGVGYDGKTHIAIFNEETGVVGSVVRYFKRGECKSGKFKRAFFVYGTMVVFNAT